MMCPVDALWDPPQVHGLSWCVIDISRDNGFLVPHSKDLHLHLVIEGAVRFTSSTGQSISLTAGDVAVQISGDPHEAHCGNRGTSSVVPELSSNFLGDTPMYAEVGNGPRACRLLSGRLKVAWAADHHSAHLPGTLLLRRNDSAIDISKLFAITTAAGATAVLNHAANLLLTGALREHAGRSAGLSWEGQSPIIRAVGLIERHPFATWSVETLAAKVGMARSSFAARFVAETGRTPIVALKEERMKHALLFVRNTTLEIGEVSEKVGYQSEAAFVRQFAKQFRITPSKLRKQAIYRVQ